MATDMVAIANPGPFKVNKKDLEGMLDDFNIYVEAFKNFLTVKDNARAGQEKKKALLKLAGGLYMVYLFKHIEKVADDAAFDAANMTIRAGITAQTNQAIMRYKLFKDIKKCNQPFST